MHPGTAHEIGWASEDDWNAVVNLLTANGLPPDGLREHLRTTLVARHESGIVGSAAIEIYGTAALLRSVAVNALLRGQGLGQSLTAAALEAARSRGVTEIYLLTETAQDFFPRFGFSAISRTEVPKAVRGSVEFTTACPETASAMRALL